MYEMQTFMFWDFINSVNPIIYSVCIGADWIR